MCLSFMRPEIIYAMTLVSQYMEKSTKMHLNAARRILIYVKGTIDYGVLYKRENDVGFVGYTDSDYVGDIDDRKSTSSHVFMLNFGAILWSSKKQ